MLKLTSSLTSLGAPTVLNSSDDLDRLVPHIKKAVDDTQLWQYYVFDVQTSVKDVAKAMDSNSVTEWKGEPLTGKGTEDLARTLRADADAVEGYQAYSGRFCTRVDPKVGAGFAKAAFPTESSVEAASRWGKILDVLNVNLYAECNEDVKAAMEGIIGRLRYTRVEPGGPRMGEINEK